MHASDPAGMIPFFRTRLHCSRARAMKNAEEATTDRRHRQALQAYQERRITLAQLSRVLNLDLRKTVAYLDTHDIRPRVTVREKIQRDARSAKSRSLKKDLSRVVRLVNILQMLDAARRGVTMADLVEKFQVTERQIFRDIGSIKTLLNFPVEFDKEKKAYRFGSGFSLRKTDLAPEEIQALLVSRAVLSRLGLPMAKNIETLFGKAGVALAGTEMPFDLMMDSAIDFSLVEPQFAALSDAIRESRRLEIEHPGTEGKYWQRVIDPYRLFYADGFWYVLSWDCGKRDIRTFALDRIRKVEWKGEYFLKKPDFDIDAYMATSWKQYSLGEPEEVVIRFSKDVAGLIKRKKWHPTQRIMERKDGSLDFSVTVAGTDEIMRWVLSWGKDARAIAPKGLAERLRREIREIREMGIE